MSFNGVGQFTMLSGGGSMGVAVTTGGEDQGAQYVAGDPCNPQNSGFNSNGTLLMSNQTKTGSGNPADFDLPPAGPPGFVAYYATVQEHHAKE